MKRASLELTSNETTNQKTVRSGLWNHLRARSRIFIYFLVYTLIMLVVIWLLQTVFLEDFYKAQVRRQLSSASQSIVRNINNDNLKSLIQRFAEQNNICISIIDEDMNVLQSEEGMRLCVIHRMNRHDLKRFMSSIQEDGGIHYHIFPMDGFQNLHYDERKFIGSVPSNNNDGVMTILSIEKTKLENGTSVYVFLNATMTPLEGTVSTIRNELFFITIALLILAFVISLLLSKRITQPIVEITMASADLKEKKYTPIPHASYQEVQQLNQCLLETAEELRKVEVMQQELIANISHDLRTPLTLIQGYAEMIRDIPEESTAENMQVIVDESKRLSTLVESVLKLNCLKKGQVVTEISVFSANELIEGIVERYNKMMEQKGYIVRYEQTEEAQLYCDKQQFEQVLMNLLNNAITYTGSDQTVWIRQLVQKDTVRFEVKDSGEGIAADDLPYIWERYYRSGKPHKRATVGSGLGLNIVKNILEAGGLPFGVDSVEGKGSTFWFEAAMAKDKKNAMD